MFVGLVGYGAYLNNHGPLFFVSLAYGGIIMLRKLHATNIDVPTECKDFFLLTPLVGQIMLGEFVVDSTYGRLRGQFKL